MAKISIDLFSGEVPGVADSKLKEGQAAMTLDARVVSGQLESLYADEKVDNTTVQSPLTLYEYIRDAGASEDWFVSNEDLDFVENPQANDSYDRVYFAGVSNDSQIDVFDHPNYGKKEMRVFSNNLPASGTWDGADDYTILGIRAPEGKAYVIEDPLAAGGGRDVEGPMDYSYVYTYVNEFGEEGPPSTPTTVAELDDVNEIYVWVKPPNGLDQAGNDTNMVGIDDVPVGNDHFHYNIKKVNIYRTAAGVTSTDFLYVIQLTLASMEHNVSPSENNDLEVTGYTPATGVINIAEAIAADEIDPAKHQYVEIIGTGDDEARLYRITAVSLGNGAGNDTITIADAKPAAITSAAAEIKIVEWTWTDIVVNDDLSDAIDSTSFYPPADDLVGLTSMSDGRLYSWKDNMLYYSHPYLPNAWPTANVKSFDQDIVVCRGFGNVMAMATGGFPYMLQGSSPATFAKLKMGTFEPCVSKRATVSVDGGMIFPSRNGLISLSMNGVQNITKELIDKRTWTAYNMSGACATWSNNSYYAFPNNTTIFGFEVNFTNGSFVELNTQVECIYTAPETGIIYFISIDTGTARSVKQYEGNTDIRKTYTWRSKIFHLPRLLNMSCARISLDPNFYVDLTDQIEENQSLAALNTALFGNDVTFADEVVDGYVSGTGILTMATNFAVGDIIPGYHRVLDKSGAIPTNSYAINAVGLAGGAGTDTITLETAYPASITSPIDIIQPKDLEGDMLAGSFFDTSITEYGTEGRTILAHGLLGDVLYDLHDLSQSSTVTFKLWVDGVLEINHNVTTNRVFKLKKGLKGREFQCQVSGIIPIDSIDVATTIKEMIKE